MAYKFNGGQGAVICDQCRKMIDANLSYREYEETWGKHGDDGDFCLYCKGVLVVDSGKEVKA